MNYFKKYIDFLLVCSVIYLLVDKIFTIEKMTNTDITKKIQEVYKIDVDAIRNLSKLANDLTLNGKLVVPGGLEIQGDVTISGNSTIQKNLDVKKQTTIHEIYGGKSSIHGFRAIQVNGGHLMFDTGDYGYGFHSNGNRYQRHKKSYSTNKFSGHVSMAGITGNLQVNGECTFNKMVKMKNAELRIDNGLNGKNGATHFNYQNKGKNYIRGTNLSIDTSNTQITKGIAVIYKLDIAKTLHVNGSSILKGNLTAANNKFRIYNNRLGSGELQLIRKNNNRGILITSNYDWKGSHRGGIWTYHDGTRVSKSLY